MEMMIHLRQKDLALDVRQYSGLALLLADAVKHYQRSGLVKYAGTALNPSMDTFVLVQARNVAQMERLIASIEKVPQVRRFLGDDKKITDYIEIVILPMINSGVYTATKGNTLQATCEKLKEAIDSGLLPPDTLHDAEEEYERLDCKEVLDATGGAQADWPTV